MLMNETRFPMGFATRDVIETYGAEVDFTQAFSEIRWPQGFRWPTCSADRHGMFYRDGRKYWKSQTCKHHTTLLSGTIFQSFKPGLRLWSQVLCRLTSTNNNVAAWELEHHLDACYHVAWTIKHELMTVTDERTSSPTLKGRGDR